MFEEPVSHSLSDGTVSPALALGIGAVAGAAFTHPINASEVTSRIA
jgi:hypothetical protein